MSKPFRDENETKNEKYEAILAKLVAEGLSGDALRNEFVKRKEEFKRKETEKTIREKR